MAASKVADLTLGTYLKVVSTNGVYSQLADNSGAWDMISKRKKGGADGRELRFNLLTSFGSAATGFVPVSGASFPNGDKGISIEGIAQYKDFALSIEVEDTVLMKAMKDFARYGAPIAIETQNKTTAIKRVLSASIYQDGTGVVATVLSTAVSGGQLVVSLDPSATVRGHIGWLQFKDKLVSVAPNGASHAPTVSAGTFDHWSVETIDLDGYTTTLSARDANNGLLTVTAAGTVAAADLIYRQIQATISDLSSAPATDYNTLSESWVGLASLTQNDGRLVNGITQSGSTAGTRKDAQGRPIDSRHFQQEISRLMTLTGNIYNGKYTKGLMAHETLDNLVESRETDRRFVTVKDNMRGVEGLGYQAGKNAVMFEGDEFCPRTKIYTPPEGKALCYYGSDIDFVHGKGEPFQLKPAAGGGFTRTKVAFMQGNGAMVSTHNSSLGCIDNFSISTI